jgi:hypothetical protein
MMTFQRAVTELAWGYAWSRPGLMPDAGPYSEEILRADRSDMSAIKLRPCAARDTLRRFAPKIA